MPESSQMTPSHTERVLVIQGERPLAGRVRVSAAKNSVLKLMAAALLAESPSVIHAVPDIEDVRIMIELLEVLGARVKREGSSLVIEPTVSTCVAPYELVSKMRASIVVLGPLTARFGEAHVSLPGGCNIGRRKTDLHLAGLAALGAEVSTSRGFITARARKLKGGEISLHFPSVGATENLMMAAVLAEGTTVIDNAAREPEIVDLADFLRKMGADIAGDGTSTITVRGVSKLEGCEHAPIPDRIEAGTYILAGVATRSSIAVEGVRPDHLEFFLEKLRQAGGQFEIGDGAIVVAQEQRLKGIDVPTMPYPGFPTDLQPQMMAALATADGLSIITENVFENRFLHADELVRMGADIDIKGSHAVVRGVETLYGVPVRAADLRGGAALVIAALGARGVTEIRGVNHIMRGYENLVEKLRGLGADVRMEVTESGTDLETGD